MAGFAFQNYLGSNTNLPLIDSDTLCRQLSTAPGGVGLCTPSGNRIAFGQRFLVGKARRNPGFNFDGTPAEDMQSGDQPPSASSLAKERIFAETDAELEERLRDLVKSLSTGAMEAVALRMVDHFIGGTGTAFEDATLNDEVRNNPAFLEYHRRFSANLAAAIAACDYDLNRIKPVPMDLLNFSSLSDKIGGLGITIHQVWSAIADVSDFVVNCGTRRWSGRLHYTLYDHFGLDWADIEKHGDDHMPRPGTGNGFKAWYILQHYRQARPFITEIRVSLPVSAG